MKPISFNLRGLLVIVILITIMASCATWIEGSDVHLTIGKASWYGPGFHGKVTANGEIYNQQALTAASRTLPFNTLVQVTNTQNGRSVIVRINDWGPVPIDRDLDLSRRAAEHLDMINQGVVLITYQILEIGNNETFHRQLWKIAVDLVQGGD